MASFPKLGLDAFCQKLLVFQDREGSERVIFDDIVKMAELHYGKSAESHKVINQRLTTTFEGAVRKAQKQLPPHHQARENRQRGLNAEKDAAPDP